MSTKRLVYIAGLSSDPGIGIYVREDMNNMKSVLESYENEGQIILRTDEYVTIESFIDRFGDNKILPWLFYFSGHSSNNDISFSDGNMAADVFVKILTSQKTKEALQLVYLGSCDSLTIGKKLIDNDVKVVIASSKKVKPHLANIVSKLFFYRFFVIKNIQEAYNMTLTYYEADRNKFNVNQTVDFPWVLLTSSETNLEKPLKPIRLSAVQKHQLVMNSTNIRLELLNYYITEDPSVGKNTDLIKEEASKIRDSLDTTLNIIDENKNIRTLIEPWKNTPTIELLPDSERIMRTSRRIENLNLPQNFLRRTVDRVSTMRDLSNNILNF